ncbi:MAG TPA: type I methionyl aminopeptidase [Candidatus Paceibacterota bacterium]|nr:type I methionyl aminopeptidase [Candidatus Paceibacterota bacterium]
MIAKNEKEIAALREAGKRMAKVVEAVLARVAPGVSSMELEDIARAETKRQDAVPAYLGYKNKGDRVAYPAALCVSINEDIAHSPPAPDKILREGDIVSVDFGLVYQGMYMDTAYTVAVGGTDKKGEDLINGTREALAAAINAAQLGKHTGDIGAAASAVARQYRLGVVKDLQGHGVGRAVHEAPDVPNFGKPGEGAELVEGLVIAIEPIFAEGKGDLVDKGDGFTYTTKDGLRAAHFEHTVLITKDGAEILTQL